MSIIYIPEISEHKVWVSDEIPEDAEISHGYDPTIHTPEMYKEHGEFMKGNQYHKGHKHTEETKKKISEKNKGFVMTDKHKESVSKANKGRKQSPEHIKKRIANRLKTIHG